MWLLAIIPILISFIFFLIWTFIWIINNKKVINDFSALEIYNKVIEKVTNMKAKPFFVKFFTPKVSSSNIFVPRASDEKKDTYLKWSNIKNIDHKKILKFRFKSSLKNSNSLPSISDAIEGSLLSTYMFKQRFITDFIMSKLVILFLFIAALWPIPFGFSIYEIFNNGINNDSNVLTISALALLGSLLSGLIGISYRRWYIYKNIDLINTLDISNLALEQITQYINIKKWFIFGYVFVLPVTIIKELVFSWIGLIFALIFFVFTIFIIFFYIDSPKKKKSVVRSLE